MQCPVCKKEITRVRVAGIYYATQQLNENVGLSIELEDMDLHDPDDFWCIHCNGKILWDQISKNYSTQSEGKSPESPQEDNQTSLL